VGDAITRRSYTLAMFQEPAIPSAALGLRFLHMKWD
jgi:hypothetical protein